MVAIIIFIARHLLCLSLRARGQVGMVPGSSENNLGTSYYLTSGSSGSAFSCQSENSEMYSENGSLRAS